MEYHLRIWFLSALLFISTITESKQLIVLAEVVHEEVVKQSVNKPESYRIEPIIGTQSNACGVQFVRLKIEKVLLGNITEEKLDTHVIIGEWCGKPFQLHREYVVRLFDKEDKVVSLHRSQADGWEVFNNYDVDLSNGIRVLSEEWEIKHFSHLQPTVISKSNDINVIKIKDLVAWYTANKSLKQDK